MGTILFLILMIATVFPNGISNQALSIFIVEDFSSLNVTILRTAEGKVFGNLRPWVK